MTRLHNLPVFLRQSIVRIGAGSYVAPYVIFKFLRFQIFNA